jgi:hypothetical protein
MSSEEKITDLQQRIADVEDCYQKAIDEVIRMR